MADQDGKLMVYAWRETMAFDSKRRLVEIGCPALVVASSNDQYEGSSLGALTPAGLWLPAYRISFDEILGAL